MRLATWNINSVRLRINLVTDFLQQHDIDVLCLQEMKIHCQNCALIETKTPELWEHIGYPSQLKTHLRQPLTVQEIVGF